MMHTVQAFEGLLKEVVGGKRLSQSKVKELTDVSMSLMQRDTQLVSSLVRSHKEAQGSHKIQSLYVVDSLARSARRYSNKRALATDSTTGNAATFLVKLETFLEDIFRDLVSCSAPEGKEKAKKILDIWRKDQTFPEAVLARLMGVVKGDTGGAEVPTDTHASSTTPPYAPTPSAPAAIGPNTDVQATLLQLINQAKATGTLSPPNGQSDATPPPVPVPTLAQLDPAQFKLFQQLASVAASATPPPQAHTPSQVHTNDPRQRPRDPRANGQEASDVTPSDPRRSNGHDPRAGRGDERRAVRTRSERSLSPIPRSQQDASMSRSAARRDLPLPTGPRAERVLPTAPSARPINTTPNGSTAGPSSQSFQPGAQSIAAIIGPQTSTPSQAELQMASSLESFDWTTFDATTAASWEALSNAWQASNGSLPGQEELMFMLNCIMGIPPPIAGPWGPGMLDVYGSWNEGQPSVPMIQDSAVRGQQEAGGTGSLGTAAQGAARRAQATDAVALGPSTDDAYPPLSSPNSGGGKMERVGDMWMFVKSTA